MLYIHKHPQTQICKPFSPPESKDNLPEELKQQCLLSGMVCRGNVVLGMTLLRQPLSFLWIITVKSVESYV